MQFAKLCRPATRLLACNSQSGYTKSRPASSDGTINTSEVASMLNAPFQNSVVFVLSCWLLFGRNLDGFPSLSAQSLLQSRPIHDTLWCSTRHPSYSYLGKRWSFLHQKWLLALHQLFGGVSHCISSSWSAASNSSSSEEIDLVVDILPCGPLSRKTLFGHLIESAR